MGMLMLEVKILKDQWDRSSALLYTRKLGMSCKVPINVECICSLFFFLSFETRKLLSLILRKEMYKLSKCKAPYVSLQTSKRNYV